MKSDTDAKVLVKAIRGLVARGGAKYQKGGRTERKALFKALMKSPRCATRFAKERKSAETRFTGRTNSALETAVSSIEKLEKVQKDESDHNCYVHGIELTEYAPPPSPDLAFSHPPAAPPCLPCRLPTPTRVPYPTFPPQLGVITSARRRDRVRLWARATPAPARIRTRARPTCGCTERAASETCFRVVPHVYRNRPRGKRGSDQSVASCRRVLPDVGVARRGRCSRRCSEGCRRVCFRMILNACVIGVYGVRLPKARARAPCQAITCSRCPAGGRKPVEQPDALSAMVLRRVLHTLVLA